MASYTKTTAAPYGLTITRDNLAFTCSWSINDVNYDGGVRFQWSVNDGEWNRITVNRNEMFKTVTLTATDYYPTTNTILSKFSFRVSAKRSTDEDIQGNVTTFEWSDWTSKNFNVGVPYTPKIEPEWDSELTNKTTFSWTTDVYDDDHSPFYRCEYQTILVKNCTEGDGSKLAWKSSTLGWGTGSTIADYSISRTEDSAILTNSTYTRWFRVRARGAGGASDWAYSKHVYAEPMKPAVNKLVLSTWVSTTGVKVTMEWAAPANNAYPIDITYIQYCIGVPVNNLPPSNATWIDALTQADTGATDAAQFVTEGQPGTDECLWVRVKVVHDAHEVFSTPVVSDNGPLAAPTLGTINWNATTHQATVPVTNNSEVSNSKIAIWCWSRAEGQYICGLLPHAGGTATIQCPDTMDSPWFGASAYCGTTVTCQRGDGTEYMIVWSLPRLESEIVWKDGAVPFKPTGVTVSQSERDGEAIVDWNWASTRVSKAEVSWTDNPNGWESSEEPSTFLLDKIAPPRLRVPIESGKTWYFRVRFLVDDDGEEVYGPYSSTRILDLSATPDKPILSLSESVINQKQTITATWTYNCEDGSGQSVGSLVIAPTTSGNNTINASTHGETRSVTISGSQFTAGVSYRATVRVTSENGKQSAESDPVFFTCVGVPTISMTNSLDDGALTELPLTVTVTPSVTGAVVSAVGVTISRSESFEAMLPDESVGRGFSGEVVFTESVEGLPTGTAQSFVVTADKLLGGLNYAAQYVLTARCVDETGQIAQVSERFTVEWDRMAVMPVAQFDLSDNVAIIQVGTPESSPVLGDYCDIYRLSSDKPQLVYHKANFGETYVDPYPAIGESGGYRVVYVTGNGDYTASDSRPAWIDLRDDVLESDYAIIDFNGDQVTVNHSLNVNSSWSKDFKETRYLGGSIQGDWNSGVGRKGSVSAATIRIMEPDTIEKMRKLAAWTGICHVRTPDGSSFSADVQVTENHQSRKYNQVTDFNLSFVRVDPERLDGVLYADWIERGGN